VAVGVDHIVLAPIPDVSASNMPTLPPEQRHPALPAGQPFAFALMDMCVELGEAAACLVLAWLVWRDLADRFQRLTDHGQGRQA
jgi:hypothetical protein